MRSLLFTPVDMRFSFTHTHTPTHIVLLKLTGTHSEEHNRLYLTI